MKVCMQSTLSPCNINFERCKVGHGVEEEEKEDGGVWVTSPIILALHLYEQYFCSVSVCVENVVRENKLKGGAFAPRSDYKTTDHGME